jgi:Zn-dependent peptidase ImmA (M78 family)
MPSDPLKETRVLAIFPEISACAKSGDIEKLVLMVRQYFIPESASTPCLDVYALVTNFGIPVRAEFLDYSGALAVGDVRGEIKASIVVNRSSDREHQNFALCHLLGHFILHVQPMLSRGDWKSSGFKESVCPLQRYAFADGLSGMSAQEFAMEDLADRFAAALLMPSDLLLKVVERSNDPGKVAQVFGVTLETAVRRLDDLGRKGPENRSSRQGAIGSKNVVAKPKTDERNTAGSRSHLDVPEAQLIRDVNQPVPPPSRAVAAHSYSDVAQGESKPRNDENTATELKGMARIRELARKLDKFGDKSR